MPEEVLKEVRISHSMADAYNACQKRYEFAHVYGNGVGLMPLQLPHALRRGIFGHKVMDAFLRTIMGREKDPQAFKEAKAAALMEMIQEPELNMEIGQTILYWFDNVWPQLDWKILQVEQKHFLNLGNGIVFPYTVDLVIEENGQLVLVDHKFAADAYEADMLDLYTQIPKYIGGLRTEGIQISYGKYNFIRTRSMKDMEKKIVITAVKPSKQRIVESFKLQGMTMTKIMNHQGEYFRNVGYTCKYCPFKDICRIEMRGDDATNYINSNYKPNEYGYMEDDV